MGTFKSDLFEICSEVAEDFDGWNFVQGHFKNKTLKHTDLHIHPGFAFRNDNTPLQPSVHLSNKKFKALCTKTIGYDLVTSLINFREIETDASHMSVRWRTTYSIVREKKNLIASGFYRDDVADRLIDISEVRPIIRDMVKTGIGIIEQHYDLSTEENFLRDLPPKYVSAYGRYEEMEMLKGLRVCLAHILLGDFDFPRYYRSDDFVTQKPKENRMLDSIIAALPELEKRFAETGNVI